MKKVNKTRGFTLIEILVVIGIIAILAAIVLIAINPAKQFADANDTQRSANVNAILNAVGQNMVDNNGTFNCATAIPTASTTMSSAAYDIRGCIVPTYISEIPVDPTAGTEWDGSDYNTGYTIARDAGSGRITVAAPATQEGDPISVTR